MDILCYLKTDREKGFSDKRIQLAASQILMCAPDSAQLEIIRTDKGKPGFTHPENPLCFSVSHSGGWWICVFSDESVGIDIQKNDGRDVQKIAARYFSSQECTFLDHKGPDSFYDIWSAKESYVKYLGCGIGSKFGDFSVVSDEGMKKEIEGIPLRKIKGFPQCSVFLCGGTSGPVLLRSLSPEE